MNKRGTLTALAMGAMLAACSRNEELGRASVDAVTDSPDNYIGRTITVRGDVSELQDDRRVFTVEDHDWIFPEDLMVVTPRPLSEMLPGGARDSLQEDQEVQVTGTVRRLVITELERDFDFDLERDFEMEFRRRPIVVASSIGLESGENVKDHPGSTVPPPADSAMLERDLPATPTGDSTRDMNRAEAVGAGDGATPVTDILVIIPVPGPRELIGQPVQLTDIPLRSTVGDRGYWVGRSHTEQVFVRLDQGETASDVAPGENATVWGTLQPVPPQSTLTEQWDLEPNAARILARNESLYIEADSIKASGS